MKYLITSWLLLGFFSNTSFALPEVLKEKFEESEQENSKSQENQKR